MRTAQKIPLAQRLVGEGLVLAGIAGWWLSAASLPPGVMPDPLDVSRSLIGLFAEPAFLLHTLASLGRVLASVALALAAGLALVLLAWRWPILEAVVADRIQPVLLAFPSLGWALVGVTWFGANDAAVLFIQVAILTPFCVVNFAAGLRALDGDLMEMGGSFGRAPSRLLVRLVLPQLYPSAVAAARIGYGVAWKVAVVAELFGAERGVAYLMQQAQVKADAALVFAACFAIVLVFVAGDKLVLEPLARRYAK